MYKRQGFNVGLIGDLRVNKYINIRIEPGLYYSKRDLIFHKHPLFTDDSDRFREVKSTYIHLPLMVKFSAARINNFRPFVLAGISSDFNLSSNHKNIDDNFAYGCGGGRDHFLAIESGDSDKNVGESVGAVDRSANAETLKRIGDLAIPALGALALDPLLSLVDTIIVGQNDSLGLAAIGLNTFVFTFVFYIFNFLSLSLIHI